jgi:DNA gyrase/topoisomerase IV subunit A
MTKYVSIDMSKDDSTAGNRIFGRVIEECGNTLFCEFESANYNLSENVENNVVNSKIQLLTKIANMELRDQLKAKDQQIKELKNKLNEANEKIHAMEQELRIHNMNRENNIEKMKEYSKQGIFTTWKMLK